MRCWWAFHAWEEVVSRMAQVVGTHGVGLCHACHRRKGSVAPALTTRRYVGRDASLRASTCDKKIS